MYIDPGTGSYIFQVVVASLVGGVALFWHKVVTFLRNLFGKKPD
jgi:hypothetical protein